MGNIGTGIVAALFIALVIWILTGVAKALSCTYDIVRDFGVKRSAIVLGCGLGVIGAVAGILWSLGWAVRKLG